MYFQIVAILLSVYSALGGPVPPAAAPIVGGHNSDKNEYPWQVMLKYDGYYYCGGSIIDTTTILTAAHCVEDDEDQIFGSFSIVAGEYDLLTNENTEQEISVDKVVVHGNYDTVTLDNDIAVVFLSEPLEIGPSVQFVPKLSNRNFDKVARKSGSCTVSGWGVFDDDTRDIPNIMQELTPTNVIANRNCNRKLRQYRLKVTAKMICTFDRNSGVCNGDSGGPMGCYDEDGAFTQVGIVSWGPSRMCANGRQVFTRVSRYTDWIQEEINKYNLEEQ